MQEKDILIGFDAKRIVRNGTGLGSYARTLVNALSENEHLQLNLYAPDEGRDDLRQQIVNREKVKFVYPEGLHFRFQRDLWRTKGVVKQLKEDGVQLYHGLSGELPAGLKAAGIPGVVTIHDLIFLRHPEYYHWWDVEIYRRKFKSTLKEASRIIAISECTKRDILYYGDFPEDKIDVIYQGCSNRFRKSVSEADKNRVKAKYNLSDNFILNVGSIEARKNVLLAVKALGCLLDSFRMVIVGKHTKYTDEVIAYVKKNGLEDRVQILHGIPDDDLPVIYHLAKVFVYPSRYEGFGIPIIEAIQTGLPVVACTGSCLEEAGGPDCLYVSPDDVEGMANAIKQAIAEKDVRVPRAQEYIKRFENSNLAAQVIEEYEKTINLNY
ncbi:MAG: glycosyltransferase family 4 protein [Prevotella sp.]|jgi:glycosyltransferase involved in cell wall biosynthesis|nr:glycosyltransferase family 4 protein [Prevotella sp.]